MRITLPLILLSLVLIGCTPEETAVDNSTDVPWVRTVAVVSEKREQIRLSGTIKGRHETPVSFQVPGRVLERYVDTGQRVSTGQPLFQLDTRDLLATVHVAEAELKTAEASLAIARAELKRQQQLVAGDYVSRQTLERFTLSVREAESRRDTAQAVLAQANNGLSYAALKADKSGVLTEVSVEPGQVIAVGQPLALLVEDNQLDVEVYLPDGLHPPKTGTLEFETGELQVQLREIAGAADPQSRSWRARYSIEQRTVLKPSLGGVAQVVLDKIESNNALRVPLGALDERSQGPQVWQVINGHAHAIPVELIALESEFAKVRASDLEGQRVISLGTHMLTPGMAVREQAR